MTATDVPAAMQARLVEVRDAARRWAAARPRTAKRNAAAQEAILGYLELDALLVNGAALPEAWSSSVTLPSVEEVAEALQAVALVMPIDRAPVGRIAEQVVKVMTSRRVPR